MQGHLCGVTDLQPVLDSHAGDFPFRSEISLKPLIDFWTRVGDTGSAKSITACSVPGGKIP